MNTIRARPIPMDGSRLEERGSFRHGASNFCNWCGGALLGWRGFSCAKPEVGRPRPPVEMCFSRSIRLCQQLLCHTSGTERFQWNPTAAGDGHCYCRALGQTERSHSGFVYAILMHPGTHYCALEASNSLPDASNCRVPWAFGSSPHTFDLLVGLYR